MATTYNCDAIVGGGTRALDLLSVNDLTPGDRSIASVSGELLYFKYSNGTAAENITTHPYIVRPNDYSTGGNWEEQVVDKADKGGNSDITSMAGLDDDGIPVAKVSGEIETAALAGSTITDNRLTRGDGGSRGVQESTIIVDDDGRMTNPNQPGFNAYISTQQNDVTGDGTSYNVTGAFWTEIEDRGNNFNNGIFTAPVSGLYQVSGSLRCLALNAHTSLDLLLITSNRNYLGHRINPQSCHVSGILVINFSFVCDMDTADTAYLNIIVSGSTKVIDVDDNYGYFQGILIC